MGKTINMKNFDDSFNVVFGINNKEYNLLDKPYV